MTYIRIDKIKSGMKLAKPLVNKFNQILLPAGTVLDDNHKQLLKKWNIYSVEVNIEESANDYIPDEIMEIARDKIKNKILWQPRNHIEKEVIEIATITLAKKLLTQKIK